MQVAFNGETKSLEFEGTVAELLEKLGICREIVLVSRNGEIIPENERVSESDSIEILQVIQGG